MGETNLDICGRAAYECAKTVYERAHQLTGDPFLDDAPPWEKLSEEERSPWHSIACAVLFKAESFGFVVRWGRMPPKDA